MFRQWSPGFQNCKTRDFYSCFIWIDLISNCKTVTEDEAACQADEIAPGDIAPFLGVAALSVFLFCILCPT